MDVKKKKKKGEINKNLALALTWYFVCSQSLPTCVFPACLQELGPLNTIGHHDLHLLRCTFTSRKGSRLRISFSPPVPPSLSCYQSLLYESIVTRCDAWKMCSCCSLVSCQMVNKGGGVLFLRWKRCSSCKPTSPLFWSSLPLPPTLFFFWLISWTDSKCYS